MHWRRKWQPTPVFLPGESQGWGTWWAAINGVAQSRTQLKQLSSSSNNPHYLCGLDVKESTCSAGDLGLIPGLGRSPGEGNGYPVQYFCLEDPMDSEAWWA